MYLQAFLTLFMYFLIVLLFKLHFNLYFFEVHLYNVVRKRGEGMELKYLLKELRKKKNITQSDLADKLGVVPTTVSAWERGANKPTMDKVTMMADLFQVPVSSFFDTSYDKSVIKIPILGVIACGEPITANENIDDYKERSVDNLPSGNVFYLRAKGDSMSPLIHEGSLVLIREQSDVENGEIAAVLVNGDEEATLKRIRKFGDTVLLESINDSYEPYLITEDNPARILGKAIESVYEF